MALDPLLARLASEESLWEAWDRVYTSAGKPGVDGVTVRAFAGEADEQIPRLARQLRTRRYRPRPLRRVWVPKKGKENEFRPLAIPAVRDRIASGAAQRLLEHVFEPLFHDCSFGFRPARGTIPAIRRVQRLRERGLRWVARADIHDCFGSIDQSTLFHRLQPVLPWEIRRLLLLWTRSQVHDAEERFRLRRGLPQGTSTSPLLANFYLTPFDEHLEFEGYELVRYADDLAVLCRTERDAHAALRAIRTGLEPLGLTINSDSAAVRSFDHGFEYLGFELLGSQLRIAPSKIDEFRRHALLVLGYPGGGSMRRRISRLNQMIRGWRAYYRAGVPREQLEGLDTWLEKEVRSATLERWAREQPDTRDLELSGLETLASSGRRVFQPPPTPSVEGYSYRVPLEGEREFDRVITLGPGASLVDVDGTATVVPNAGPGLPVEVGARALVIADGARLEATAVRLLLEKGVSLRFVPALNRSPTTIP